MVNLDKHKEQKQENRKTDQSDKLSPNNRVSRAKQKKKDGKRDHITSRLQEPSPSSTDPASPWLALSKSYSELGNPYHRQ